MKIILFSLSLLMASPSFAGYCRAKPGYDGSCSGDVRWQCGFGDPNCEWHADDDEGSCVSVGGSYDSNCELWGSKVQCEFHSNGECAWR